MTECAYSRTRVDHVYGKVLSWERKEITKNSRNGGERGGKRGETGEGTLFHSRNLIRARREKSGRARLNGSMRKRGVFEVGRRRHSVKRRRGIHVHRAAFWWTSVALCNNRWASRGVAWQHAYETFAAFSFQHFSSSFQNNRGRDMDTQFTTRKKKYSRNANVQTNTVIWENHLN